MLLFYASYMSFIGVLELHTIHRAAPNLLIAGTIITYIHMDEGALCGVVSRILKANIGSFFAEIEIATMYGL